jgi:hypothetical protein
LSNVLLGQHACSAEVVLLLLLLLLELMLALRCRFPVMPAV